MSKTSRRKFSAEFKAKVCVEALKEQQTIEALAKRYNLHPTQIYTWKKEFLQNSSVVFEKDTKGEQGEKDQLIQALYAQIGEQKVALDFLKKNCRKAAAGAPYAGRERTSRFKCGGAMRTACNKP